MTFCGDDLAADPRVAPIVPAEDPSDGPLRVPSSKFVAHKIAGLD
jgi:hypothetical protein